MNGSRVMFSEKLSKFPKRLPHIFKHNIVLNSVLWFQKETHFSSRQSRSMTLAEYCEFDN